MMTLFILFSEAKQDNEKNRQQQEYVVFPEEYIPEIQAPEKSCGW